MIDGIRGYYVNYADFPSGQMYKRSTTKNDNAKPRLKVDADSDGSRSWLNLRGVDVDFIYEVD